MTYTFFRNNRQPLELSANDVREYFDAEINSEICPDDVNEAAKRLAECWGCRYHVGA